MSDIRYVSTRGEAASRGFIDAMMTGLAEDGGLFVPDRWPQLDAAAISDLSGRRYEDVAVAIMRHFTGGDFAEPELQEFAERAYRGFDRQIRCPLVQAGDGLFLLELFHGPTLAFKDFAMQMVGQMLDAALARTGGRVTILGATSGDTGSAAIEAFRGMDTVDLFVLYPEGRVSDIQRRQMTTADEPNVHAIAIDGDFDDCQALVKALFGDHDFRRRMRLAAINSINWARILAQTVYYFHAAVSLGAPGRKVGFSVPTGNFGDVYSGYVAGRMGLPIDRLIIATNQNDILHRALAGGSYETRPVRASISPSMDIQVSSNFERVLFEACGRDAGRVRSKMQQLKAGGFTIEADVLDHLRDIFHSGSCSEQQTMAAIRTTRKRTGLVVCPHTAVGIAVADELHRPLEAPLVTLATAHPAKFPEAVEEACGIWPELPDSLADIGERPERINRLPNDPEQVMAFVAARSSS